MFTLFEQWLTLTQWCLRGVPESLRGDRPLER